MVTTLGSLYQAKMTHLRAQQKSYWLTVKHASFCLLPQAHIKFPVDYPYSPPTFRFLTKMWHPNIYEVNGVYFAQNVSHNSYGLMLQSCPHFTSCTCKFMYWCRYLYNKFCSLTRTEMCASPSCTLLWTTLRAESYPPRGGTPPRTSGERCHTTSSSASAELFFTRSLHLFYPSSYSSFVF